MIFEKTLFHWFCEQSNEIHRGVPSTLDNIKTEADLVNLFIELLFVYRTQLTHKTKFKHIVAATVMRFHDVFIVIIGNEPSGKYKYQTYHPFHHFWDIFLCSMLLLVLCTEPLCFYDEKFDSEYL